MKSMPNAFYRTGRCTINHNEFGGTIYSSDFTTFNSLADVADRIASDRKFNIQCQRIAENRKCYKEQKRKEQSGDDM